MKYLNYDELIEIGFSSVGVDTKISRRAIFYDISGSIGDNVRIDDFSILTGWVVIGNDAHISPFCFLGGTGGRITLGVGVGLSTHVSIFTKSDDYQERSTGLRGKVSGDVFVGDYSIFGAQCVLLPGAEIGKHCSIGVGCVVHNKLLDSGRYISVGIKSVMLP
ncbi:acyltransferase [Deefgea piscis]|uniref:acyltransferase n=1 Tax=Deefgea piscis TaxID=2739061 RepID=UPI001C7FF938|nr:acyltransferase [Deefgea piscis]QZA80035.1 acyltransferase [Deefgea piscis]